ncbi:MAG: glycoside hydrolase family 9 protein [Bacteroidales bacterium]|nr:glycoside hydrolase family 9 protein [Bacteroidales bacterium]
MRLLLTNILLLMSIGICHAQFTPDAKLNEELLKTGFIHTPLQVSSAGSMEERYAQKKVRMAYPITLPQNAKITFATDTGKRATGSPDDPDYAIYGSGELIVPLGGINMEQYNRIYFEVFPRCEGARVVNTNLVFENESSKVKKGFTAPTGAHLVNLKNNEWNCCSLEIDDYQRDNLKQLRFYTDIKGKDLTTGDSAIYLFRNIRFEQVEQTEKTHGWEPALNQLVYSTSGYRADGEKMAIISRETMGQAPSTFQLIDDKGNTVYEGKVQPIKSTIGEYGLLDFSRLTTNGTYLLRLGNLLSLTFPIKQDIWTNSEWRVLNFIFGQRCGFDVPGIHSTCHTDLYSHHNGLSIPYAGGWHDAGDLSQQTLQTADVMFALLEASEMEKGKNTVLSARLLEEARWGLDFVLKNRYGDGYRASSMGLLIWQDGKIGSRDDIHTVRVQNMAYDNFLYAAYEAFASQVLTHDKALQTYLRKVAEEDFHFALEKFEKEGYDKFIQPYEHTFNTSESQYHATICWAACELFKLTQNHEYEAIAIKHMDELLACQQVEEVAGFSGFFWRNRSHKSVVHYIHQSREQLYATALVEICKTFPQHEQKIRWEKALKNYGDYLKKLMSYTYPYGMIPSGIYHKDEQKDTPAFQALHLFPPTNAEELYTLQLQEGVKLNGEFYLKRFPVWFNIFNGNEAVILAMAKGAALLGDYLNDVELKEIAEKQLYWTVGLNPFGQSLIYGEGSRFTQMDSFSSGEITGEIPVGIRTYENTDEPWWPTINNACYKEVWTPNAGKWLSVIASLKD